MSVITRLVKSMSATETPPKRKYKKNRKKRIYKGGYTTTTGREKRAIIMDFVNSNEGTTTCKDIVALGVKESSAYAYLTALVKEGKLKIDDETNPRSYCLPEVDTDEQYDVRCKLILDYVAQHAGESYSIGRMTRELPIPASTVYWMVNRMKKHHILPEGFNEGTKAYVPEDPQVTEPTPVPPVEPTKDPLFDQIEFLAWSFIRDTRTTDILAFITWLEQRSK